MLSGGGVPIRPAAVSLRTARMIASGRVVASAENNDMKYNLLEFLNRSTDKTPELLEILKEFSLRDGIWLAGGAIRRQITDENVMGSDFDFFFRSQGLLDEFHGFLSGSGYEKKYQNEHNTTWLKGDIKVQTIHISFYENPEILIDSFDFTICQLATDGESLFVGEYALWDIARKRLALHKLTYGVSTIRRLIKYARQGYTACPGTLAGILESAVNDPSVIQREVNYID